MLLIGSLNQPKASGPTGCNMKPLISLPISVHSWSYNSLPPPYWNQDKKAKLSIPTPAPATGEPNNIAAG